MTINPNDPAFPTIESINHNGVIQITTEGYGLTIRAEIAARAMQGLCANQGYLQGQSYIS